MFGDLDRLAPEDAILASNSSSYPTSQFIDGVSRPGRVANTHYYRPPEVNVVEVMSCGNTTDEVIARLFERLPAYGLLPLKVLKESEGFIYNRIWAAIKRESLAVVAEGVSTPEVVDQLFQGVHGSREGPFRIMDKVGLDVVLDIEEHYAAKAGSETGPPSMERSIHSYSTGLTCKIPLIPDSIHSGLSLLSVQRFMS